MYDKAKCTTPCSCVFCKQNIIKTEDKISHLDELAISISADLFSKEYAPEHVLAICALLAGRIVGTTPAYHPDGPKVLEECFLSVYSKTKISIQAAVLMKKLFNKAGINIDKDINKESPNGTKNQ